MLKFFRKIRQKLINEGNLKRYLIYAIGEILLVMIGILLALQVNNWNESNKLLNTQKSYLKEIRNDLIQDTIAITAVIGNLKRRLSNFMAQDSTIEPRFNNIIGKLPVAEEVINMKYYFGTERPFRPKPGTYKSMISEGKSSQITNRQLFNQLQGIYEDDYISLKRIDSAIWENARRLRAKYAYESKFGDYGSPIQIQDKQILADLNLIYEGTSFYTQNIILLKSKVIELIKSLDSEIESL